MTPFLFYLLKLSISLGAVYLFYRFILQRLTFYNWNRWYLVSYSLLSFFIPFVDISVVLDRNEWSANPIVQWVPSFEHTLTVTPVTIAPSSFDFMFLVQVLLLTGMVLMLARLVIQLISFRVMMRKARMIPADGMNLYQVDQPIIPFSFGKSIFINRDLHNENELSEIILHEFIHVKQTHSVDIIFCELLCLFNWYNPFAWLIRRSIRQNLEFIADNQVLENGIDRKQYQYLLLKVIGNNHFSIAPKFNFSSLKKRIAMMNKMKSAGVHLVKFLFILPMLAVLLLAFRNQYVERQAKDHLLTRPGLMHAVLTDTLPNARVSNSKGYYIDIKGINGECTVVVKNKEGKEVERVLLNEWKANNKYDEQYGEILPAPPALTVVALPAEPVKPTEPTKPGVPPVPPVVPVQCCPECPDGIQAPAVTAVGGFVNGLRGVATSYEITDQLATVELKDGTIEKYDLTRAADKSKFENKYGQIITSARGTNINPAMIAAVKEVGSTTSVAPAVGNADDEFIYNITGKEDVLLRITKYTTKEQLEQYKNQMKDKGIDLTFSNIEYNSKGELVLLSGRMKSNSGQSNFVADDFEILILAAIIKGDKTLFTVRSSDQKEPI